MNISNIDFDDMPKRKLAEPRNVHIVTPRVCAFCNRFYTDNGFWGCVRSKLITGDAGDGMQYETTCDLFKHQEWNK